MVENHKPYHHKSELRVKIVAEQLNNLKLTVKHEAV